MSGVDFDPDVPWQEQPIDPGLDTQPVRVAWTLPMVLAFLRVPPGADRETVLAAARDRIDRDELSVDAGEVLAANGYPELDPDLDYDDVIEEE